ncbi:MAG: hypothetical protein AB9907_13265 [Flexilinea sp.]
MKLKYRPLEYIKIERPVNRIDYIINYCKGKKVLDLGFWDETALVKKDTEFWLHKRICQQAHYVIGVDSSDTVPDNGSYFQNSIMVRGDVCDKNMLSQFDPDIIIAGELIEHLPDALLFLTNIKEIFPNKKMVCSSPNATNISNCLLALFNRESTHKDHLHIFSYKTLSTLCSKADFSDFRICPYNVKYTEMIARNKGIIKISILLLEKITNFLENLFPFLSGGYIIDIDI